MREGGREFQRRIVDGKKEFLKGFLRAIRNNVFGIIYNERMGYITGGRGEMKNRGKKEDKVVIQFKDKKQFRAFSPRGKGKNFKRRLEIVNKGGAEFR